MVLFHYYEKKKIKPSKGEESAPSGRKRLLLNGDGREKPSLGRPGHFNIFEGSIGPNYVAMWSKSV